LAGFVNVLAAPVSGIIFDAIGARWLYGLAITGYAMAFVSLWLTRPNQALVKVATPAEQFE